MGMIVAVCKLLTVPWDCFLFLFSSFFFNLNFNFNFPFGFFVSFLKEGCSFSVFSFFFCFVLVNCLLSRWLFFRTGHLLRSAFNPCATANSKYCE